MGSIMGKHIGKGRFLQEENFSKELVLGENYTITETYIRLPLNCCFKFILYPEFNLGPLHLLEGIAKETFNLKKRVTCTRRLTKGSSPPISRDLPTPRRGLLWPHIGGFRLNRVTCGKK